MVWPGMLGALTIVRPETLIRWHRAGFRRYWRWKSRPRGGRPKTEAGGSAAHSRDECCESVLGRARIHGELLKLGIDVGQTTVAKYMARGRRPPSQGWKTFLRNHADGIASMDLFVVPTISFQLLYGLANPTAWPPRNPMAWGNHASKRRMDKSPTDGGLWLGAGATLSRSRSGQRLWRCLHPAPSGDGHSGSANRAAIAMAEWLL